MRRILVALLAGATIAGCGGGEKFERSDLEDGSATGPGYEFELPRDWDALDPNDAADAKIAATISKELPGFDAEGFAVSFWADPSDEDRRPTANVAVEAVTADSRFDLLAKSGVALARSAFDAVERLPRYRSLDGEPAVAIRYQTGEVSGRAITARHAVGEGVFLFTLTTQMRTGNEKRLDALTRSIAEGWRWRPASERQAAKLGELRKFRGGEYEVELPLGWRGTGSRALRGTRFSELDSLWRGWVGAKGATNVNIAFTDRPAGASAEAFTRQVAAAESEAAKNSKGRYRIVSLRRGRGTFVDGEPAGAIELVTESNGNRVRQRELVVAHGDRVGRITFTAPVNRYAKDKPRFDAALDSWRWTR